MRSLLGTNPLQLQFSCLANSLRQDNEPHYLVGGRLTPVGERSMGALCINGRNTPANSFHAEYDSIEDNTYIVSRM